MKDPKYAIGDRVEVNLYTSFWFPGTVTEVREFDYNVRFDRGSGCFPGEWIMRREGEK